jgi:hypothetical protein
MSLLRRSTRAKSSKSVAAASQTAEILAIEESDSEEQSSAAASRKRRAREEDADSDYRPSQTIANDSKAECPPESVHLRKRANSGDSVRDASDSKDADPHEPDDSDAERDEENTEETQSPQRELGPLSDRGRGLPAGTQAAVQKQASALFEMAVASENDGLGALCSSESASDCKDALGSRDDSGSGSGSAQSSQSEGPLGSGSESLVELSPQISPSRGRSISPFRSPSHAAAISPGSRAESPLSPELPSLFDRPPRPARLPTPELGAPVIAGACVDVFAQVSSWF